MRTGGTLKKSHEFINYELALSIILWMNTGYSNYTFERNKLSYPLSSFMPWQYNIFRNYPNNSFTIVL